MGFENVGRVWTPTTIGEYLATLARPSWVKSITLHHCAEPSLAQRPNGLTAQHIVNIKSFYSRPVNQGGKGWSTGPHFFVDEDQMWGMCDPTVRGIHAVSFNSSSIGIEVLGDYDREDNFTGRGLDCWKTAAQLAVALLKWLKLSPTDKTVLFHRDDPTTSKTCPGRRVQKAWVLGLIELAKDEAIEDATKPHPKPELTNPWNEWQFTGDRWCVPVLAFLTTFGMTSKQVTDNLKRKADGNFYFGSEMLEGAYYHGPTTTTWAPVRELLDLPF